MTADKPPGHDASRAGRDAQREQERAATRARQQAAYRQAQSDSRSRAVRAAARTGPAGSAAGRQAGTPTSSTAPEPVAAASLVRSWRGAEDAHDRSPTDLTAIELVQQRLEEAELQQALLAALAALPADQRVAVVAALGYAEGSAGAAVELDVAPRDAEQLAQQGLDALRHALSPFLTRND